MESHPKRLANRLFQQPARTEFAAGHAAEDTDSPRAGARHYAEKLAAAGYSESGRTIPMAHLLTLRGLAGLKVRRPSFGI
jgi:hypothetical protein